MIQSSDLAQQRHALARAGYSPIPVQGKVPAPKAWEQKTNCNPNEIELWDRVYPYADNTGILTRFTPTIDIDILNGEAAEAIEALARERFEERGYFLVRIGQAPKRAIPLRTDEPFKKITCNVIAPEGSEGQKIELLGDGQQVVVAGIHPDTGKPYTWHGGEPGKVRWDDLPYVTAAEAQAFVDEAARLLVTEYAYKMPAARPKERARSNGHDDTSGAAADWGWLITNIRDGRELHDSICKLAAKLIPTGMNDAAAVNFIRGALESSTVPHDGRWQERYADVPRAVTTAREKFKRVETAPPEPADPLVKSSSEFIKDFAPPNYLVDGMLQRRYCYALTARTGDGKTALALLLAACIAQGVHFGGHATEKGRVLIFAGENPDDIRARWIAMSVVMNFDINTVDVHFIPGTFKISALVERVAREVEALGGVALIIVDTSAAFFEGKDENDNVQAGAHARMLRNLVNLRGGPTAIINCHPIKNAADDNLCPRGGGAFVNEVDGNLIAIKDADVVSLHHQVKFRGVDFAPINFVLKTDTYDQLRDAKGRLMPTVIARHLTDTAQEEMTKAARSDDDLVLQAIKDGSGGLSIAEIAKTLNWLTSKFEPNKSKVQRTVTRLKRAKLAQLDRGRYVLTDKGKRTAAKAA